ncbi:hypothetical protein RRF57_011485 [Xylaria bambusicola]|uniref:Uncharacterized protein n=1 Tax=Xylaria bambusicola TaxID=326684 RepID=A0AAN7UV11_9PEZI
MSHLTEFSNALAFLERLLREEVSDLEMDHRDHGKLGWFCVQFPLAGMLPLAYITEYYSRLHVEVEGSRLKPERKAIHRQFMTKAYLAYRAAQYQPHSGTKHHLRGCLFHITQALQIIEKSKEYDDEQPVHWSEVYPATFLEGYANHTPPEEYWLLFKLESLWPVLDLSVRVLRLVMPDCQETWDEWEATLYQEGWLQQFILDSRLSLAKIPLDASRQIDMARPSNLEDTVD